MMTAGMAAAVQPLLRRQAWDQANRTVAIALDYDDVVEASVRAGIAVDDLLHRLWHSGATHLTIPEDTLARLMVQGRIGTTIPRRPLAEQPPFGRWTYLAAHEDGLLSRLQLELAARQPQLGARLIEPDGRGLLVFSGDLPAVQDVGLGFDSALAQAARAAGLEPLPRPVSYPWPTVNTIERSLAQAAALADTSVLDQPAMVAFQGTGTPGHVGELILGHEMLMRDTIKALRHHRLALAYFVESRHQRGDWFVAKSLAPDVVLAHEFTQAQLIVEDMHSAAYRWGILAREKGIRLCLLRLFKVVHATTPLDCIAYVAAVADALVNREGMLLSGRPDFRPAHVHHSHDHGHSHSHDHGHHHHDHESSTDHGLQDADRKTQITDPEPRTAHSALRTSHPAPRTPHPTPWLALIPAGAGALVAANILGLPERLASAVALAGLAVPLVVAQLDRPTGDLDATFHTSYGPKLVALGIATLAPLAAGLAGQRRGWLGLLEGLLVQEAASIGLAAVVAEHDYVLRIEEVRTANLDWMVPLAGTVAAGLVPAEAPAVWRLMLAGTLGAAGLAVTRVGILPTDPLSVLDTEHTVEHTHHLSRFQAALGDARMAISPRPLRKWTGLTLAVQAAAALLPGRAADAALVAGTMGAVAYLTGFRQAARPISHTFRDRLPWPLHRFMGFSSPDRS